MRTVLSTLILLVINSFGYVITQNNWSGGPGVPGPDHYWYYTFLSESYIEWSGTPGKLCLEAVSTRHNVGDGVSGTQFVYPGDINGDGAIDVVTSSSLGKKHVWFENDGTGINWIQHLVFSSATHCYGAYPVDVDGDSDLDITGSSSEGSADSIFWFENLDGLGTDWGVHLIDTSLSKPYFLIGADIDGDLDIDVIAGSGNNQAPVFWYENLDGQGSSWQKHDLFNDPNGFWVNEIHSTDLDLDGDLDLLVAYLDNNGLVFCKNVNGTGVEWSYYPFDLDPVYEVPYSVHTGDLDNDGDLDIAVTDGSAPMVGRVLWLENLDGSCENWDIHILEDSMPGVNSVHVADLTNDGNLDILVGSGCGWGEQLVLFWENVGGTGNEFARRDIDSGYDCWDVNSADIDNDGVEDAITNNHLASVFWLESMSHSSGSLISSIRDMWADPEWELVDWDVIEPPGTEFSLQVRGSDDPENMGEWSANIYEPGDLSLYLGSTSRYIQYKVIMETFGRFGTPLLDLVAFQFGSLGIEQEWTQEQSLRISSNPCYGTPTLSFHLAESGVAEVTVYDITGREVFRASDDLLAGNSSFELSVPTTGTYFARIRSDEETHMVRFAILSE